ncbi:spore germination protein GerM [Paenibacillus baekrokdamisoli]|uniref:Spore germination protein GerM n=1 Tax=Paenibacillus baekrokdamisoli TaxID=1712516 RepID=A0A3G9IZV1_9BACL|nr:GerMN domain-containing protein [Paenibacillus baekrokdamisoli]MBB3067642.1 germination protein M [Paenibacillus baekrokdamisoli]BBH19171.1 spore germination protein GerM [Paenibacillus baekrokdamisoli]
MTHYRLFRRAALAGALALPILTTGCGLFSQEASQSIDPPQNSTQNVSGNAADNGTTAAVNQKDQTQMTVYLKDHNGLLAPVTVLASLGGAEKAGQKALELMVDGGSSAKEIPEGFQAIIPKGTTVKNFTIVPDQKLAVVDFSKSFAMYTAAEERQIVEAVTWTLTGMPGINKVDIWMEGKKLAQMPVNGLPMDGPLTRSVGINLQAADGVNYSQSTPVTLYFSAVTPNNESYYVPVTRLVNRSDNKAKSAIQQLINGPLVTDPLTAVITPDVVVKSVTKKNDIITVELQDNAYQEGQQEPAEMLQAVVLALTENTTATKVQIKLNGKTNIIDTNNQSYSEPVSRPEHVNAFKS